VAKIFPKYQTSMLNLKSQNMHIKRILNPQNTFNKSCAETAHLDENWLCKKLPKRRNFAQSGHTVWNEYWRMKESEWARTGQRRWQSW
jgi:hypothetical protein